MQPPYYAVIFTAMRTDQDLGYAAMAAQMDALANEQPGFLGMESARDGVGITVSYWESLEAIAAWKEQVDHRLAQEQGRKNWYTWYKVRICLVERQYQFKTAAT